MLDQDDPRFANWDQDATARAERYNEQEPATVAAELGRSAEPLAAAFDDIEDDQWSRRGRRSDGAAFTIESFAQYLLHDPVDHLLDVEG